MDSNSITAKRVKSSSDDGIIENRLSYKESMTTAELSDNIEAAEMNYESIHQQVERLSKVLPRNEEKNDSGLSQESTSSYSSLKQIISENFFGKNPSNIYNQFYVHPDNKRNVTPNNQAENQVQIVVTPRTPNKFDDKVVPNLEVRADESFESVKTNKRTKKSSKSKKKSQISRMSEDQLKTSLIYSAKTKRKKFHGRLKNSTSKCTIGTRDTNFSDKKVEKKKFKRQKSIDTLSSLQPPQYRKRTGAVKAHESRPNPKDFIEIFHNQKHDNPPVIFSRQPKASRNVNLQHEEITPAPDKKKKIPLISEQKEEMSTQIDALQAVANNQHEIPEKRVEQTEVPVQRTEERSPNTYDPFHPRNYEMPTESSKNRQVQRPYYYYNRINMRHIPFVPGTSLSPSHNLGLNIQQVLGIIKSKQPAVPGIDPALIRQVSQGLSPVTSLFQHINDQFARSCRNLNRDHRSNMAFHQSGIGQSCEHLRASSSLPTTAGNQNYSLKQNFTCEPLYEEDEEIHSSGSETRARNRIMQENSTSHEAQDVTNKSRHNRQRHSRKHGRQLLADVNITDSLTKNNCHHPVNTEEMSEVFSRLYDQFNKMIAQHDKLKAQLEKRNDKSLVKEIAELEAEMSAKEQEIAAVVNLYKEVMSLKQQMKLMYERNSFVCITKQDPAFYQASKSAKARARTAGYYECRSKPKFHHHRRANQAHHTPNALRLVGLLRQIQAFQRQLNFF